MSAPANPTNSRKKEYAAALLLIGDELLSGRTQDVNLVFIAKNLGERGINLAETRIVADEEKEIIAALNALRQRYDFVFTTGGIGPTHDDITAQSVALAFDRPLIRHPEAVATLEAWYANRKTELNQARLRMANTPEGASLIKNKISGAPGFKVENVYVMAGIPAVMQAMLTEILPTLPQTRATQSHTLEYQGREGDIASNLAEVQKKFTDVKIGSYPSITPDGPVVRIVLRHPDSARLEATAAAIKAKFAVF